MADFTDEIKHAIVIAHAQFKNCADIVALVFNEFGVETDVRQVGGYDPERSYYEAGEKWRTIFDAARKNYLEDVGSIAIGTQAFRLNELQQNYLKAKKEGKVALANSILEQAAKEVGGVLTNERNLNVDKKSGGYRDLTPEERRMAVAEMIHEAMARDPAQTAPTSDKTQ